ncbi:hypothetical protein CEH05_11785 [Halobacillus halophilus]|uniref:Na+-translocating membrane potential-generating system MpsC domain-containing protein n=1 Tax=Halobacillus halophilus (strain ATCC 35676 / DSM 2266 / JCM 20832 / KCTC 3685 / LMG 17431 / NBRC 102448 / NCIMB 2269) TaxID=866895 RepID=I0JNK5_HALH3|nr:hypothetical protein CEH05_11785 [Halobacillus halophilus]CCG45725.1 hypothetical protein HBHAL_3382 [Halobacillus halophilus DSM 2266]
MEKKSLNSEIAGYIGKLLRDNFGKGPTSVYVSIKKPFISIYLKDFLAPIERLLVGQKNYQKVEETRDLMFEELIPEIKATLRVSADLHIKNFYYDWSLENKTGVLLGVMDNSESNDEHFYPEFPNKEILEEEMIKVSEIAQKAPDLLNSMYLNNRTLVMERKGILTELEKELIREGNKEQLLLSKRQLEKRLLDIKVFESILGVGIKDVFVDWDFYLDISYLIFIVKPK